MLMVHKKNQAGAVSIFIVVFTALLITIVAVSFVRIMVRDQQQASTTDLSQSAYDAALAGVEDGKRALVQYLATCPVVPATGTTCYDFYTAFDRCDGVATILGGGDDETLIQSSADDVALNQAYTCAMVRLQTDDYLGELTADQTNVIPLVSSDPFNTITIEWFSQRDLPEGDTAVDRATNPALPLEQDWPTNRPSVLEAQLIQYSAGGFTLDDFDNSQLTSSNANTLTLYPFTSGSSLSFLNDVRRSAPTGGPSRVQCADSVDTQTYACRATITLPNPVAGDSSSRVAFLRLTPRYNGTNYRISLQNGGAIAQFNGVQPAIDVTARANDIFRRVETRVEASGLLPYPTAAVSVSGNLCKTFSVTDNPDDYASGACNPNE